MIKSIYNIPEFKIIQPKGKSAMKIEESITKMIKDITKEAKNYISDVDFYRDINVSVRNNSPELFCKSYGISIEQTPDSKSRHFLSLNLLAPNMKIQSSRTLAAGNKQEILEFLQNEDSLKLIKTNLLSMSENMENK